MTFIITKLILDSNLVEIKGIFDTKLEATQCVLDLLQEFKSNVYVSNMNNYQYIKVYQRNYGYLYNDKTLRYIYQISKW